MPTTSTALRVQNDQYRQQQQKDQKAIDYLQASVDVAKKKNQALTAQVKELQQLNARLLNWLKTTQEKALTVFTHTRDWAGAAKQAMTALFQSPQAADEPETLLIRPTQSGLIGLTNEPEKSGSRSSQEEKQPRSPQKAHKGAQEQFELHLGINTSSHPKTPSAAPEGQKKEVPRNDDRQRQQQQERLKQNRLRTQKRQRDDGGLEL